MRESVWFWPLRMVHSPSTFFENLKERWPWVPAYLMAVVCSMAGTTLTLTTLRSDLNAALGQAGADSAVVAWVGFGTIVGTILGGFLAPLVIVFAYSFVATFLGLIYHRHPEFSKLFAVVMWCFLPTFALGGLARGILIALQPALYPHLTLSPAAFLAHETSGTAFYRFLTTLDFFQLGFYALFTVGYAKIAKLKITPSLVITGILYFIQLLIVMTFSTVPGGEV